MSENGDEVFGYESVDELQSHGINVSDIGKLKANGIVTVLGVAQTPRKNLAKIKGLSEAKIEKLKEVCAKLLPPSFATGVEVSERRATVFTISTGSKAVDGMLGGGISTQSITEVYGEFRTGKTQLCHTLCVSTQLPEDQGGAAGKVAYIDTEGTFRPDRVRAVADRFGVDGQQALENILCARAWSSEQQCELLVELAIQFMDDRSYKLIIVDSIMNLFRQDYSGRGELSERQQKLNLFLSRLQKLAEEFNVAVVLTNQVQADPGAAAMFAAASSAKPVGGHVLAHASATRIQLRKGRGEERIAKLQDSPDMPEGEATYCLKSGGWEVNQARCEVERKEEEGELAGAKLELMSATKRVDLQASRSTSLVSEFPSGHLHLLYIPMLLYACPRLYLLGVPNSPSHGDTLRRSSGIMHAQNVHDPTHGAHSVDSGVSPVTFPRLLPSGYPADKPLPTSPNEEGISRQLALANPPKVFQHAELVRVTLRKAQPWVQHNVPPLHAGAERMVHHRPELGVEAGQDAAVGVIVVCLLGQHRGAVAPAVHQDDRDRGRRHGREHALLCAPAHVVDAACACLYGRSGNFGPVRVHADWDGGQGAVRDAQRLHEGHDAGQLLVERAGLGAGARAHAAYVDDGRGGREGHERLAVAEGVGGVGAPRVAVTEAVRGRVVDCHDRWGRGTVQPHRPRGGREGDDGDEAAGLDARQQVSHRPHARESEVWVHVRQRAEDELTLRHTGVRDSQPAIDALFADGDDLAAVCDQVDVEHARAVAERLRPPHLGLDLLQHPQELERL